MLDCDTQPSTEDIFWKKANTTTPNHQKEGKCDYRKKSLLFLFGFLELFDDGLVNDSS